MIVMVVAEQHKVDGWQVIEADARGMKSCGTGPANRTGAVRPDGVRQNIEPTELQKERRMIDEGDPQRLGTVRRARTGLRIRVVPHTMTAREHPAQKRSQTVLPRHQVLKPHTVEVGLQRLHSCHTFLMTSR